VIRCGMCPWSSPVCSEAMSLPTQPSETAELARQATELHLQGRLAEAIECYRQLLRATPEHPRLHYNLGVRYTSWGTTRLRLLHTMMHYACGRRIQRLGAISA